jgi:hypothetical protein
MLIRENELRLSPVTQQAYADAELRDDTSWMHVTEELQKRVVREFGIEDIEYGLTNIRIAHVLYPNEQDFKEIPLYVKYNRCRQGNLHCGDYVPHVDLKLLTGKPVSLSDFYVQDKPLVIVGGSYS